MKNYILSITALLLLVLVSCRSGSSTPQPSESATPTAIAQTTPPPVQLSPIEIILSVVPNRSEHRNFVRVNNYEAVARAASLEIPGPDATFAEVHEFRNQVFTAGVSNRWSLPGDDFLAGYSPNSPEGGADFKAGLGFDTRNTTFSAVPGIRTEQSPARYIEIVFGEFDPELTLRLLQECVDCADAPEIIDYRGQTYFSWDGDGNAGQNLRRRNAQPAFDHLGSGGRIFVGQNLVFRTTYSDDMEAMIDASLDSPGVYDESESWAMAAKRISKFELFSVSFTNNATLRHEQIFSLQGLSEENISNLGADVREAFENKEQTASQIRAASPELPRFDVAATGIGREGDRDFAVIVAVFASEQEAAAGLDAFQKKAEVGLTMANGFQLTPWSDEIERTDFTVSGRVVSGKVFTREAINPSSVVIYGVPFIGLNVQPFSRFLLR